MRRTSCQLFALLLLTGCYQTQEVPPYLAAAADVVPDGVTIGAYEEVSGAVTDAEVGPPSDGTVMDAEVSPLGIVPELLPSATSSSCSPTHWPASTVLPSVP